MGDLNQPSWTKHASFLSLQGGEDSGILRISQIILVSTTLLFLQLSSSIAFIFCELKVISLHKPDTLSPFH